MASIGGIAAIAAVIGLGSLTSTALADSEQQNVPLNGAKAADVAIRLNAGNLDIHGGAATPDLLSGSFDYSTSSGEPKIDYSVVDERGDLTLEPKGNRPSIDWPWDMLDDTQWNVQLNDSVPTDLKVDVNAATLDLALGGTSVVNLDVDANAAKASIDLSGTWTHNFNGILKANAGQLVVTVPEGVGVRIETVGRVNDTDFSGSNLHETENNVYVNDAYATATVKLTLKAETNAGQLIVKTAP
jgi:hypothetical protein